MFRPLLYLACLSTALVLLQCSSVPSDYQADGATLSHGKELFARYCASCHGIQGDGIGPRLGGITKLLSKEDLKEFIGSPEKVMASGNERALAQLALYKQQMPSFEWIADAELEAILAYVHEQTLLHQIAPLEVSRADTVTEGIGKRLVAPIRASGLKLELEDFVQIPKSADHPPDKGIATLRPHPSGDGTIFVSDQAGVLYRVSHGKAEAFLDLRDMFEDFVNVPGIASGFGSFDFHPDFLTNGLIYITHTEGYRDQDADYRAYDSIRAEIQWILTEWKMENSKDKIFKGTHRELLRLHPPTFGHGAQDIGFIPGIGKEDPDYGLLYLAYGDGGSNNIKQPELGHHLRSYLGTILRIDPTGTNSRNGKYGIPADNPFVDERDPQVLQEIYAYGFRNPHRISWYGTNGRRMFVADIGESNIEEINIVEKGGDYGWPAREGDYGIATTRDLKRVFKVPTADGGTYRRPFAQYDHEDGFAVSGGYVYEGSLASLKGKYFLGDIVSGKVFYLNIDPPLSDSAVYEVSLVYRSMETNLREMTGTKRIHLRISYDHLAGDLYVITKCDGWIRRVVSGIQPTP